MTENVFREVTSAEPAGRGEPNDVLVRSARDDVLAGKAVESATPGALLRGTASGIDRDGRLIVRGVYGVVSRISSGEIRLGPI